MSFSNLSLFIFFFGLSFSATAQRALQPEQLFKDTAKVNSVYAKLAQYDDGTLKNARASYETHLKHFKKYDSWEAQLKDKTLSREALRKHIEAEGVALQEGQSAVAMLNALQRREALVLHTFHQNILFSDKIAGLKQEHHEKLEDNYYKRFMEIGRKRKEIDRLYVEELHHVQMYGTVEDVTTQKVKKRHLYNAFVDIYNAMLIDIKRAPDYAAKIDVELQLLDLMGKMKALIQEETRPLEKSLRKIENYKEAREQIESFTPKNEG
jgi:hypothetical protein